MGYRDFSKGADRKCAGKLPSTISLCARRREGSSEIQKVNGPLEGQFVISQRNEIVDLNLGMRATYFVQKNHAARK
jgi:hypothetical protein